MVSSIEPFNNTSRSEPRHNHVTLAVPSANGEPCCALSSGLPPFREGSLRTDVPYIKDVVAADCDLERVGDVVPGFQMGQAHAGLAIRNEGRGPTWGCWVLLRPPIGLAECDAELIQCPVGSERNLLLWRAVCPPISQDGGGLLLEEVSSI